MGLGRVVLGFLLMLLILGFPYPVHSSRGIKVGVYVLELKPDRVYHNLVIFINEDPTIAWMDFKENVSAVLPERGPPDVCEEAVFGEAESRIEELFRERGVRYATVGVYGDLVSIKLPNSTFESSLEKIRELKDEVLEIYLKTLTANRTFVPTEIVERFNVPPFTCRVGWRVSELADYIGGELKIAVFRMPADPYIPVLNETFERKLDKLNENLIKLSGSEGWYGIASCCVGVVTVIIIMDALPEYNLTFDRALEIIRLSGRSAFGADLPIVVVTTPTAIHVYGSAVREPSSRTDPQVLTLTLGVAVAVASLFLVLAMKRRLKVK